MVSEARPLAAPLGSSGELARLPGVHPPVSGRSPHHHPARQPIRRRPRRPRRPDRSDRGRSPLAPLIAPGSSVPSVTSLFLLEISPAALLRRDCDCEEELVGSAHASTGRQRADALAQETASSRASRSAPAHVEQPPL